MKINYNFQQFGQKRPTAIVELECDKFTPERTKLRMCVLWAIKNNHSLRNANLTGADLTNIDFTNIDLTDALLISTDITGANFSKAILKNTDFTKSFTLTKFGKHVNLGSALTKAHIFFVLKSTPKEISMLNQEVIDNASIANEKARVKSSIKTSAYERRGRSQKDQREHYCKNGVLAPQEHTKGGRFWKTLDEFSNLSGHPAILAEVIKNETFDMKISSLRTQYSRWRIYNGISKSRNTKNKDSEISTMPETEIDVESLIDSAEEVEVTV